MDVLERRRFASDVRELRRISAWWRGWAAWAGLADEAVDAGELCLNEAVANIILHGGGDEGRQPIEITFEQLADAVRMTIVDTLQPFNPLDHPMPQPISSLDDAPVGGLGIQLVRAYASDVQYRRDNGQNVLTLLFSR